MSATARNVLRSSLCNFSAIDIAQTNISIEDIRLIPVNLGYFIQTMHTSLTDDAMSSTATTTQRQRVKIVANAPIADGVSEMLLEPIEGNLRYWTAGAHVVVHLPSGRNRKYSLTGDPSFRNRYRLAIKLEREGNGGSREMHELAIGSTVSISGPVNNFSLIPSPEPHLLLAGGIGITPLVSMAYDLARAGRSWRMIVCSRSPESTPFQKELSDFSPGQIDFVYTYGNPDRRLVFEDLFSSIGRKTRTYLCGSGRFNQSAARAYRASGLPPEGLVYESFSDSGHSVALAEEGFSVELAVAARKLWVPKDKSILDVLEAAGVSVESACREGYCGSCVVDVLDGSPIYRDDHLFTDEERSSGKVMTLCRCRAIGEIKISL